MTRQLAAAGHATTRRAAAHRAAMTGAFFGPS